MMAKKIKGEKLPDHVPAPQSVAAWRSLQRIGEYSSIWQSHELLIDPLLSQLLEKACMQ
jgi:hypothetical protein